MTDNDPLGFFAGDPELDSAVRNLRDCVRSHAPAGFPMEVDQVDEREHHPKRQVPTTRGALLHFKMRRMAWRVLRRFKHRG